MTLPKFPPPSLLVSEISLLKGGGGGGGTERLKNGNASNVLMLFPLAYRMYKIGSTTVIYFQGCYNIRVKNFVADIACQGVTAFKSVQSDIFVAF